MKVYKRAILPIGFKANGVASGIKKFGKLDLALFFSEMPAKASCLFTTNTMQAAPVTVCKSNLNRSKYFRAIIANSGNANCFTSYAGIEDAKDCLEALAEGLSIKGKEALIASTGIIGKRLPLGKIRRAIPGLIAGLSREGIKKASSAILTTDTFTKQIFSRFVIGKRQVGIYAVAKGAGMIAPDMATMLCFIFTDANITQSALDKALKASVVDSFNCITVDGCMSTNDSVILLANSAAGNQLIKSGRNFKLFSFALRKVCTELAKLIVRDAEGASKFIQIHVNKAASFKEARKIALNIANSNLVKTAIYGEDPNFGRIVASVGATGIKVKQEDLKMSVSSLKKKDIYVKVTLNRGRRQAIVYTSDLTPEYIKINAQYN